MKAFERFFAPHPEERPIASFFFNSLENRAERALVQHAVASLSVWISKLADLVEHESVPTVVRIDEKLFIIVDIVKDGCTQLCFYLSTQEKNEAAHWARTAVSSQSTVYYNETSAGIELLTWIIDPGQAQSRVVEPDRSAVVYQLRQATIDSCTDMALQLKHITKVLAD